MNRIESFTVNHLNLKRGIYVSRKDVIGEHVITTFDIRLTSPNREPVLNTAELHTIEHLGATFLRNHPNVKNDVIYFGPMGCRTGFYLILKGDLTSKNIVLLVTQLFEFIRDYTGDVPGASAKECGNYLDLNLEMAKYIATNFLEYPLKCISDENLIYPIE